MAHKTHCLFRFFAPALLAAGTLGPVAAAADDTATALPAGPDTMVVTASRVPVPARSVGASLSVLTADQIENRHLNFAADLFRTLPGIAVNRSGSFGAFTQLRLRGAESNQVLVLIDGIEASDPARGEFDFANLAPGGIERIEVLRGEQSALWGSDAIGGVINIITTRGSGAPVLKGRAEYGSFDTYRLAASLSGAQGPVEYAFSASRLESDGTNIARTGSEKDGYDSTSVHFKGGLAPSDTLRFGAVVRYVGSAKQFDADTDFDGLLDDADRETETDEWFARVFGSLTLFDGQWTHELGAALTDVETKNFTNGRFEGRNDGAKKKLGYQTSLRFGTPPLTGGAEHRLTFVAEVEKEDFTARSLTFAAANQDQSITNKGLAGEYALSVDERYFFNAAVRRDINDRFKDATTFSLATSLVFPDSGTRLRAQGGTGVKNPTFVELFGFFPGSFIGNPGLKPEKSTGWSIGIAQSFLEGAFTVDLSYFHSRLKDEVFTTFDFLTFLSSPANRTTDSRRAGVEIAATATPLPGLDLTASYTYTDSKENGVREIRRPRHLASFNANYRFLSERANLNLDVTYNGRMEDDIFSFPIVRTTLSGFTLVNVSGSFDVTDNVSVFVRVENALDDRYEEIVGYRAPGAAAFGGLRVTFGTGR